MITLKGKYKDRKITISGNLPTEGEYFVFITFFTIKDIIDEIRIDDTRENFQFVSDYVELLTAREQEVLELMQIGATNAEIAETLDLADGYIRNCTSSIYEKLKVRNRTEAIHRANELGILSPVKRSL